MKKILTKILCFFLAISPVTVVMAKSSLSIGDDYGNISSREEATTAYNYTKNMGYISYLLTSPSYKQVGNAITTLNNFDGGVLFFLGHANSDMIVWNSTGISRTSNYDMTFFHAIQEFRLSDIDMAIFMGCNSAYNTSANLPKTAYNSGAGAKRTVGWYYEIYEGDTDIWVTRFYTKLANGGTFLESINYANNYNYSHNM